MTRPDLKRVPLSKNWMAVVCFVCCLILPGTAMGWTVGERGDAGSIFLYDQPLEGVYSNNWWGRAVHTGGSSQLDVHVTGEGKTVDFVGVFGMDCLNTSQSDWKSASNFGEPVSPAAMEDTVPGEALANARQLFCK